MITRHDLEDEEWERLGPLPLNPGRGGRWADHRHGDCPKSIPLMEAIRIPRRGKGRPRTRPGAAMGDKAYSSAANRGYLRRRAIKAVIPVKEDQKAHRRHRGSHGGRPPSWDGVRVVITRSVRYPRAAHFHRAPGPPAIAVRWVRSCH